MTTKALALSDLLDLPLTTAKGGKARSSELVYVRDLTAADLSDIGASPGAQIRPLVKIRNTHHALARLIAEGRPHVECSAVTGYAQTTISNLLHDPAFQELVSYYATQKEAVYLDVHMRLAALGVTTIEELQQRIEENPEKFTNDQLTKLMEATMDRSVAPSKGMAGNGSKGAGAVAVTVQFVTPPPPAGKIIDIEVNKDEE